MSEEAFAEYVSWQVNLGRDANVDKATFNAGFSFSVIWASLWATRRAKMASIEMHGLMLSRTRPSGQSGTQEATAAAAAARAPVPRC